MPRDSRSPLGTSLAGSLGLSTATPTRERRGKRDGDRQPSAPTSRQGSSPQHRDTRGRRRDDREAWPAIPEWVDPNDLGKDVRADLRGLNAAAAEFVSGHLVAASTLADDDPDLAWEHAQAARSQGGRIAVVRETVGLVAYRTGRYADVLRELRAARRMAGGPGMLAVMADAHRGLGEAQRAIDLGRSPESRELAPADAAELTIVAAGARADLGQHRAALAELKKAARRADPSTAHAHRVYYAYAAMLLEHGPDESRSESLEWFVRAADTDTDGETDAAERAADLGGDHGADHQ